MIQLKHRDGTTIDLDGITDGQARAMTVALGKGWAFGTVQPVPTFTPIDVAPAPKPARKPRGPAWAPNYERLGLIMDYLRAHSAGTARQIEEVIAVPIDEVTRHLKYLIGDGKVTLTGKAVRLAVPAKVDGTGAGVQS